MSGMGRVSATLLTLGTRVDEAELNLLASTSPDCFGVLKLAEDEAPCS